MSGTLILSNSSSVYPIIWHIWGFARTNFCVLISETRMPSFAPSKSTLNLSWLSCSSFSAFLRSVMSMIIACTAGCPPYVIRAEESSIQTMDLSFLTPRIMYCSEVELPSNRSLNRPKKSSRSSGCARPILC